MSDADAKLIQNSYQMCYVKKVFLKISYNSLENTYFEGSFVAGDRQLCFPHMHKMGLRGHKHCIFGNQFYSKNARKLRFYVLLHFHARKHMISSFYLKWTEFTRNCEFGSNLVKVTGGP